MILVCSEGYSSSISAASLQDLGLRNATDLIGGFQAPARRPPPCHQLRLGHASTRSQGMQLRRATTRCTRCTATTVRFTRAVASARRPRRATPRSPRPVAAATTAPAPASTSGSTASRCSVIDRDVGRDPSGGERLVEQLTRRRAARRGDDRAAGQLCGGQRARARHGVPGGRTTQHLLAPERHRLAACRWRRAPRVIPDLRRRR